MKQALLLQLLLTCCGVGAGQAAGQEAACGLTAEHVPTPAMKRANTSEPNDVIFNEYWVNDDENPYASLDNRGIDGDWLELLVARAEGVDLRGWRITNNPTRETNSPGGSSGSLIFPDRAEFENVPGGTVILVIADATASNDLQFPVDDLDPGDGTMILYVGNGTLDAQSETRFTIRTGNEILVLLHPGLADGYADDVGVDLVGEGSAVTPESFGVAPDGVVWANPFNGIGDNDGALFTNDPGGGLNNDDGSDQDRTDDQPGPGGWIVDPPRQFTGDDPGNPLAINILTPGKQNTGQTLPFEIATPTPSVTPTRTPVPGLVDWLDLFEISRVWEETGYAGPEDLNRDGNVDALDLFRIHGSWH